MRKFSAFALVIGGLILLLGVAVAGASENSPTLSSTTTVANTPPEGAELVGSATCFQCHSSQYRTFEKTLHPNMIQDVTAEPEAVLADFSAGDEFRKLDDGTSYDASAISLTLGNKYHQRFLLKTDAGYTVLPGQWDVQAGAWADAPSADWLADCAGCHTTGFNAETQTFNELGVTCEACHGPASKHVEAAKALTPDSTSEDVYNVRQQIVATVDSNVCAQCHTRGESADGAHPYPVGYVVGGPMDETMFVPVAATGAADDPHFWMNGAEKEYRMQSITWSASRHGNALATITENDHASETCLGCHSTDYITQDTTFPQDAVTMENAQFSITCVTCHAPHGGKDSESQLQQDSYDLCISCHNSTGASGGTTIKAGSTIHHPMREMFEGVSFLGLDPNPSFHFSNEAHGPVCASCHMPGGASDVGGSTHTHQFKAILPAYAEEGQANSCTGCHTLERSEENTPENLTFAVESVQEDTKDRVTDIRDELTTITADHPEWDPKAEEKSDEQKLAERINTLVSFVESDGSWGWHNPGYTDDILSEAEDNLDELLDLLG